MRVVAALGGNALLRRGERPDAAVQLRHVQAAAEALAPLARDHELIVCHGNGPQVGLLALETEADAALSAPYPLDVLGAQTQGMIGYWLTQALRNAGVPAAVAVVSQTLVADDDPSFAAPTKFIGPVYDESTGRALADRHGWPVARDGAHWRRVVASPEPVEILELEAVMALVRAGVTVVCAGGGGSPVVRDAAGALSGRSAVVDKDLTAALLALATEADHLLLLTDVPAVLQDFGTDHAVALSRLSLQELAGMSLPAGSMGPKAEACRRFVGATGRPATIGAASDAVAVLAGTAGTRVTPDGVTGQVLTAVDGRAPAPSPTGRPRS